MGLGAFLEGAHGAGLGAGLGVVPSVDLEAFHVVVPWVGPGEDPWGNLVAFLEGAHEVGLGAFLEGAHGAGLGAFLAGAHGVGHGVGLGVVPSADLEAFHVVVPWVGPGEDPWEGLGEFQGDFHEVDLEVAPVGDHGVAHGMVEVVVVVEVGHLEGSEGA